MDILHFCVVGTRLGVFLSGSLCYLTDQITELFRRVIVPDDFAGDEGLAPSSKWQHDDSSSLLDHLLGFFCALPVAFALADASGLASNKF